MNNVILSENFSKEGWLDYFDYRSNYFRQIDEEIKQYNDETFSEVIKLGVLELPEGNRVIIYFIKIESKAVLYSLNAARLWCVPPVIVINWSVGFNLFFNFSAQPKKTTPSSVP